MLEITGLMEDHPLVLELGANKKLERFTWQDAFTFYFDPQVRKVRVIAHQDPEC